MSKTGPILVFLRIHPFARVFFSHRGIVYSRHRCCILSPSCCIKCEEVLSFPQSSNQRQSGVWITSGLPTTVRICAHSLAPGFPVAVCWYWCQQEFPSSPNDQMLQVSPSFLNIRIVPCKDLLLLRRHRADSKQLFCGEATRCLLRYL